MKKIAWVIIDGDSGSGGLRTVLQNLNFLASNGYENDLYVINTLEAAPEIRKKFEKNYFDIKGRIFCTDEIKKGYDIAIATYYTTANIVSKTDAREKFYFVQDYEPWFFPMDTQRIIAEYSYKLGLKPITIGNWLAKRIEEESEQKTGCFSFCADLNNYKILDNIEKENAICCIFQPEKPRRCSDLVLETIEIVSQLRPKIKIYLYGSKNTGSITINNVEHLGLLSVDECCKLYNKCLAGLSISSSNPSRVPFEMMACGLPVVDLYRENNLYDFPDSGCLLAEATPQALASALIKIIDNKDYRKALSKSGSKYMSSYSIDRGFLEFKSLIDDFDKNTNSKYLRKKKYKKKLFTESVELINKKDFPSTTTYLFSTEPQINILARIKYSLKNDSPKQFCKKVSHKIYRKKKNILFINGCYSSMSERYRVDHLMEQLSICGISSDKVFYENLFANIVTDYDGFIFFRCPITNEVEKLIRQAHELKKPTFFDIDDLMFDAEKTSSIACYRDMTLKERELFDDGVIRTKKTLNLCNYGIVSTNKLKGEVEKYKNEVFLNRNVASMEMVRLSNLALKAKRNDDKVIMGYFSGTMTHNRDFETIMPCIVSLLKKYDNLYLKIVGQLKLPDYAGDVQNKIISTPFVDWHKLPALISSVDINLAPLEKTEFNEAKSENKWMEAALVLVPTIAANIGSFKDAIEDGKTGLLALGEKEWTQKLTRLIDDKNLRLTLAKNANRVVLEKYLTTSNKSADFCNFIKAKISK